MAAQKLLHQHRSIDLGASLSSRVLDSLPASIAVLNRSGGIEATNRSWDQFAIENDGDPKAVGVGVNYLDICRLASGDDRTDAERAWQGIKEVLEGRREVFTLEYPCHSPTQKRWFLLHVTPLKGDPSRAVAIHLSITDRKLIETALFESAQLAAIGQAMKGLSHKGRNLLQHAQGFIDLLRCSLENDAEATLLLERIETSQRRLIGLYEEVQRYADPIYLQYSECLLEELVERAWQDLNTDGVQLILDGSVAKQVYHVDRKMIQRLLRSVFHNALTTDPIATQIDVRCEASQIESRPAVTMIISDDGPGIDAEAQEHLFEPFYTTKINGTGLGLSMARRIAKAHGGSLACGASVLGGASFYLTLPLLPFPSKKPLVCCG